MPINNITQTVSELPAPPHRGVDIQTVFVTKQEDFQDHLQGVTVDELNALVVQQNTMAGAMNSTATQVNTNANTATTKAGEANNSASSASTSASQALTSASQALTSRNQAETFAQQAEASAESVDVNNLVHRTGDETIAGIKTFTSSPIVPTPTSDTEATNKAYVDAKTVATAVPTGTIITVATNTAPTGYLKANGALVSRTTYDALFVAIGTTFGIGDGSTTFALPDLRGYFPRAWDDARGIDTGRVFGSNQNDAYLNHSHTASSVPDGAHTHTTTAVPSGGWRATSSALGTSTTTGTVDNTANATIGSGGAHTHTITVYSSTTGLTETRPKNIALLYCIKY